MTQSIRPWPVNDEEEVTTEINNIIKIYVFKCKIYTQNEVCKQFITQNWVTLSVASSVFRGVLFNPRHNWAQSEHQTDTHSCLAVSSTVFSLALS